MIQENLKRINAYSAKQPVIVVDGVAYPIGYDTRSCTATAADIAEGKTAATADGIVTGVFAPPASVSFAKVTEYKTPHDAFSAVSSVEVSGIGEIETWDGAIDFSEWNGSYAVTAETEQESSIEKRIFKHTSSIKYLYYMYDSDYEEYFWVMAESPNLTDHYSAVFAKSSLASGSWQMPSYDSSASLTLAQNTTDYPAQEFTLNGKAVTYEDDTGFVVGTNNVSFTDFDHTPVVGDCYAYSGTKLLGRAVALSKANAVPTDFTSDTSHAGYTMLYSHVDGVYPYVYVVFNQDYTTADYGWYSGNVKMTTDTSTSANCWFGIELPEAISPTGIFIMNEVHSPENFKTAVFQGCNDGASWENIIDIAGSNSAGYKQNIPITGANAYKYFRVLFTSAYGSGVSVQAFMIYKAEYKE